MGSPAGVALYFVLSILGPLSDASAASPGAATVPASGSLSTVLLLLGVVASAYLLTHFVVERAQQRFLFVSGGRVAEHAGFAGLVWGWPAIAP